MNINFTLIAQAITFAIFVWFTVKFVWPPLLNAIEKRQKGIRIGNKKIKKTSKRQRTTHNEKIKKEKSKTK